MKKTIFALFLATFAVPALADCGTATTCNLSEQVLGDSVTSADNAQSQANQANPSSNSNSSASNVSIDPKIQQSGNTVDQYGEQWSQSHSNASGNRVDLQTGPTSASNGDQSFKGSVGDSSAHAHSGDVTADIKGEQSFVGTVGDSTSSATTGNNWNDLANQQGQEQYADSTSSSDQAQSSENTVNVDNSDKSSTSYSSKVDARSLYIPSIAAPVVPSTNPSANTTVIAGQCGPMFSINREAVHGTFSGFFRTRLIEVGHEDFKSPFVDEAGKVIRFEAYQRPDRGWDVYGHQAIYTVSVVNVSGSRHFGVGGGGGSSMNWGQGQGGGSSAMQRMVTNIQVEPCLAGTVPPPPAVSSTKKIRQ